MAPEKLYDGLQPYYPFKMTQEQMDFVVNDLTNAPKKNLQAYLKESILKHQENVKSDAITNMSEKCSSLEQQNKSISNKVKSLTYSSKQSSLLNFEKSQDYRKYDKLGSFDQTDDGDR